MGYVLELARHEGDRYLWGLDDMDDVLEMFEGIAIRATAWRRNGRPVWWVEFYELSDAVAFRLWWGNRHGPGGGHGFPVPGWGRTGLLEQRRWDISCSRWIS